MSTRSSALVSVVIPTHNRRAFLERALKSALDQTHANLEVIVVDDGSTDGTWDYLTSLDDDRVTPLHQEQQGCGAARNTAVGVARGEWTAFLDDDDIWAPHKLEAQLEAASARPDAGWVGTGTVIVDTGLNVISGAACPPEPLLPDLYMANFIPDGPSTVMVRTDLLREVGRFDVELRHLEDWDMWLRLAKASPFTGANRPLVANTVLHRNMSYALEDIGPALRTIEQRYRADRSAHGLRLTPAQLWDAEAQLHINGGRRRAASYLLKGRRRIGGRLWLPRTVSAALAPRRLAVKRFEMFGRLLPPGWIGEAEGWLTAIPAAPGPGRARPRAGVPRPRR